MDLPIIVYLHRGGWVFGSIEEADPVCRKIAKLSGAIVISVGYRLAPEHPFPKPLEDCYTATAWVTEHAKQLGGNGRDLVICGESVGGNMAAAVALMARDRHGPHLSMQLLLCPVITSNIRDEVYEHCADRYFITKESMTFFWNMYLQAPDNATNPYASPDRAGDFSNLPPVVIITAEHDPLRFEAEEYAKQLELANVDVTTKCFPNVVHCFIDLPCYDEKMKCSWIQEILEIASLTQTSSF